MIIAREPWQVRHFAFPALKRWESLSRMVSGNIIGPSQETLTVIAMYGFAESHVLRKNNEDMIQDALAALSRLTNPSLLAGDLNVTREASPILSSASDSGMHFLSPPHLPTTMSRDGSRAKSPAIDHVIGNLRAFDSLVESHVEYSLAVSDHFPVAVTLRRSPIAFRVQKSPTPPKDLERIQRVLPYPEIRRGATFRQWQEVWKKWLSGSYAVKIPNKKLHGVKDYKPKSPKVDQCYSSLTSLLRALDHYINRCPTPSALVSIRRKAGALDRVGIDSLRLLALQVEDMRTAVQNLTDSYVMHVNESAIAKWKEKSVAWNTHTKHIYRYIKNPPPMKITAVLTECGLTNHPYDIDHALRGYWGAIERWPAGASIQDSLIRLEETYSFLLPRVQFEQELTPFHLHEAAKHSKPSAPGMDAWTHSEIRALPLIAWETFLEIYHGNDDTISESLLNQVRRIPFEKKEGVCQPQDIRPIDLYSGLIRTYSSATYNLLKWWSRQVLHQQQYASQGGILLAISKFALRAELSALEHTPAFAISVDFSNMFNMLSREVAQDIASYMGLSDNLIACLAKPVREAVFQWRLPSCAVAQRTTPDRGLPQGLASSVLMAELAISPLMWRIERSLSPDQHRHTMKAAYVDDLNVVCGDLPTLQRVLTILIQFERDFGLHLALNKTKLWSSQPRSLASLSRDTGMTIASVVDVLGGQWVVNKGSVADHPRETARIRDLEKRLSRIQHLQCKLCVKIDAISTACLSLLDFVNHPSRLPAKSVRALVKRALHAPYSAPEILYNSFIKLTLDPVTRWPMAGLRIWYHVIREGIDEDMILLITTKTAGRLGHIAKEARQWQIEMSEAGFIVDGLVIRVIEPWFIVKKILLARIKKVQYSSLADRRPHVFGGLESVNAKQHRQLLNSLPSYEASVLLQLWTGAAMTKAKWQKIDQRDPTCECGCPEQTLFHVLWHVLSVLCHQFG